MIEASNPFLWGIIGAVIVCGAVYGLLFYCCWRRKRKLMVLRQMQRDTDAILGEYNHSFSEDPPSYDESERINRVLGDHRDISVQVHIIRTSCPWMYVRGDSVTEDNRQPEDTQTTCTSNEVILSPQVPPPAYTFPGHSEGDGQDLSTEHCVSPPPYPAVSNLPLYEDISKDLPVK